MNRSAPDPPPDGRKESIKAPYLPAVKAMVLHGNSVPPPSPGVNNEYARNLRKVRPMDSAVYSPGMSANRVVDLAPPQSSPNPGSTAAEPSGNRNYMNSPWVELRWEYIRTPSNELR